MRLRRSSFVHDIRLATGDVLLLHALTQRRMTVTAEVASLLDRPESHPEPATQAVAACLDELESAGFLCTESEAEERDAAAMLLAWSEGSDPDAALARLRRRHATGAHPYWRVEAPRALGADPPVVARATILLFGDCDVQMETDFLRQEASSRGIALTVAATFAHDIALARERPHDAVIVGALQARHAALLGAPSDHGGDPARVYVAAADAMLRQLREATRAPILLDALPEPSVQPLGVAERGLHGHRNRVRRINLALADLAERHADVHIVDLPASFAEAGSAALIDDGLVGFSHFGGLGWMLQRPEAERRAVHGLFPDMAPLAERVAGDPYRRERVAASAHIDALATILALDRRKCVIVDLDGVLWPGTLAETGAPFAWTPEISGPYSFIGLYVGIHEALRALMQRGILLACVSKNDEATIRRLWRYAPSDPFHRLLAPEHFVTWRINWDDKAGNIAEIAAELGFANDAFVFIDDTARERERVRTALPGIEVWGEDLFALRRRLLTDPRLQVPRVTADAAERAARTRAAIARAGERRAAPSEAAFLARLAIETRTERLGADAPPETFARCAELFARTTQFNATGRRFAPCDLAARAARPDARIFCLHMRDALADHGLVGAAVVTEGEIENLVMSCRVIGLGGERALLAAISADPGCAPARLRGRIVATDRNLPVRNLYADAGFVVGADGAWRPAGSEQADEKNKVLF